MKGVEFTIYFMGKPKKKGEGMKIFSYTNVLSLHKTQPTFAARAKGFK